MVASGQDGGIGRHASSPQATIEEITIRSQKQITPEPSENRAVWKSDNQGFKKPHSTRQVGGTESQRWGGEAVWSGQAAAAAAQTVPHSRVVHKSQEGYPGSERSQPQATA